MKLDVRRLRAVRGGVPVLEDVTFTIPRGSIVTLLGANGSGKTTLLKTIARTLKPQSGCVLLDGGDIRNLPPMELARKMAVLPQLHHVSDDLTVEELAALGRYPHRGWNVLPAEHDRAAVDRALELTRMTELRRRPVASLSGGERQRAWIAMTLAQEPELLLLDEPTTFLDICCQFEIIEVVRTLNRDCGITVVMALHDLNLAAACSDELILLKDRRIRCAGKPIDVMTPEILREVFEIETEISVTARGIPFCAVIGSTRKRGTV